MKNIYNLEAASPPGRDVFPHIYLPDIAAYDRTGFTIQCRNRGFRTGSLIADALYRVPHFIDIEHDGLFCVNLDDVVAIVREELAMHFGERPRFEFAKNFVRNEIMKLGILGLAACEDIFSVIHLAGKDATLVSRRVKSRTRKSSFPQVSPIRLEHIPRGN